MVRSARWWLLGICGLLGIWILGACGAPEAPPPPPAGAAQGRPTLLFFYTEN